MLESLIVEEGMIAAFETAAVEAVEADVEAVGGVDGVEALGTVFPVDGLSRGRSAQLCVCNTLACCFEKASSVPFYFRHAVNGIARETGSLEAPYLENLCVYKALC